MHKSTVLLAQRLNHKPNEARGSHPIIEIITELPKGEVNSFYIDPFDLKNAPIKLSFDHPPSDKRDLSEMNAGDDIAFDIQDGLHKAVMWNGRKIRQRGYSFDTYDPGAQL